MNISVVGKKCVGCSACEQICPKDAIKMIYNEEGFLYPVIDNTLCVNCGICNQVCPTYQDEHRQANRTCAYQGYSKDEMTVKNSSSGGAFSIMAEYTLENNGIVFGVKFDKKTKEVVYTSTDECVLDEIRRSKYVTPNPKNTFSRVKHELISGRNVLYCGLPCHIEGLYRFLGKEYKNLVTCDFICGGVPSERFFKEHLEALEMKYKSTVKDVNFRAKLYGWKDHSIKITFDNGKTYCRHANADSFFRGYLVKPYQRDCCYMCNYRLKHYADLTIADYWGGANENKNNKGVSMVIVNTNNGYDFAQKTLISSGEMFEELKLEKTSYAFSEQKERFLKGIENKKTFMKVYEKHGFEKAAKKLYFKDEMIVRIKVFIKQIMGKYSVN